VVRHAQMIGQTLPCPRCQGPVHVAPPLPGDQPSAAAGPSVGPISGQTQPSAKADSNPPTIAARSPAFHRPTTVHSDAITKVDPADWDLGQIEAGLAATTGLAADRLDEPLPDFSEIDEAALDSQFSSPGYEASQTTESSEPRQTIESAKPPGLAPHSWQNQQAKERRQLLLLGTVGVSGCLLAVLGFFAFLQIFGKAKTTEPGALANPGAVADPSLTAPATPNVATSSESPIADANAPDPSSNLTLGNASSDSNPAAPADNASNLTSPIGTDTASATNAPPNGEPEKTNPTTMAPALFSLSDPANPSVEGAGTLAPKTAAPTDEPPIEEELPEIFQEFRNMFDRSSQNGWDDVGKGERILDNELTLENAEVTFKEEFFPPAIDVPNWADRSERKFAAIRSQPMNLFQAVDWLNKLGGIGISVDWFSLNLSSIDGNEPIVLQGENISLGQLLNQLCEAKGLEPVEYAGSFLFLRPKKDRMSGRLRSDGSTEAGSLAVGLPPENDQAIVELLIQWWGIEGCRYENGRLQWADTTEPHTQAQLLSSLQSVREAIAAQPPTPSRGADPYDFARPAAWVEAHRLAQKPIPNDVIFHEERPVMDLLIRAAESSKANLLFDWPPIWSHGFHPGRLSISILRGRNLEEVSNRYLDDHSLELVPLDSQSLLLTTDSERRATTRIIALRTDRGVSLDEIKQSLRPLVPRGPDQRSRFRCVPLPGDENVVLVLICPPTLAQLRDIDLVRALGFDRND
jgi:hypothetical protein